MAKNKTNPVQAKSRAGVQKKFTAHSASNAGPATANELICAHFHSMSTNKNYSSAVTNAINWLKLNFAKYNNPSMSSLEDVALETQSEELSLFHHKDALLTFDKPVEVTAELLAAYITYRVTQENRSVFTVETLCSAFKHHFKDL